MYDLNAICEAVKKISIEAGNAIMEIYQNEESFGVTHKKDDSPLTIADGKANQIICDNLVKLTPNIPIISEENKLTL